PGSAEPIRSVSILGASQEIFLESIGFSYFEEDEESIEDAVAKKANTPLMDARDLKKSRGKRFFQQRRLGHRQKRTTKKSTGTIEGVTSKSDERSATSVTSTPQQRVSENKEDLYSGAGANKGADAASSSTIGGEDWEDYESAHHVHVGLEAGDDGILELDEHELLGMDDFGEDADEGILNDHGEDGFQITDEN
ncbi:unnamed protein product, partial [Amoebophrya sp. A25]